MVIFLKIILWCRSMDRFLKEDMNKKGCYIVNKRSSTQLTLDCRQFLFEHLSNLDILLVIFSLLMAKILFLISIWIFLLC